MITVLYTKSDAEAQLIESMMNIFEQWKTELVQTELKDLYSGLAKNRVR